MKTKQIVRKTRTQSNKFFDCFRNLRVVIGPPNRLSFVEFWVEESRLLLLLLNKPPPVSVFFSSSELQISAVITLCLWRPYVLMVFLARPIFSLLSKQMLRWQFIQWRVTESKTVYTQHVEVTNSLWNYTKYTTNLIIGTPQIIL